MLQYPYFAAPAMHVLFIPKWYPVPHDPQLGDFLRKQALAVSRYAKASVLHVALSHDRPGPSRMEVQRHGELWELHCHYHGSRLSPPALRRIVNFPRYWGAAMAGLRKIIAERGLPDICHAQVLIRPALVARYLKREHGIPFILSEHSSEYLRGSFARRSVLHKRWARHVAAGASMVTAVSPLLGEALVANGLTDRYEVLPNVVPGLERPVPPPGSRYDLLIVADLVDRIKNVSGALRAFAKARAQQPLLHLRIIGDGPDRAVLEELARTLRIDHAVEFLGRLDNDRVLDRIATCGRVIVNSNVETFSIVTGEAIALGRPVIATRCGGPTAFITGMNGILTEPGDETGLCQAILRMAGAEWPFSPADIRATLSDRMSYEAVGKRSMELYQRVIDGHRSSG